MESGGEYVTQVISGIFVIISAGITYRATRKNTLAQAALQKRSVDSEAFEVAEGLYLNAIKQLQVENKELKTRVTNMEAQIKTLKGMIRDDLRN